MFPSQAIIHIIHLFHHPIHPLSFLSSIFHIIYLFHHSFLSSINHIIHLSYFCTFIHTYIIFSITESSHPVCLTSTHHLVNCHRCYSIHTHSIHKTGEGCGGVWFQTKHLLVYNDVIAPLADPWYITVNHTENLQCVT